jgi:ribosome recycling factor
VESSNLGVNPQKEDKFVRLIFPALTQDRRDQLIKVANSEKENCRVEIKKHREIAIKKVNAGFNDKTMSEDQKIFLEKEIQKEIDKANDNAEMLTDKKIKELKEI